MGKHVYKLDVECQQCGKWFLAKHSSRKYCSRACLQKAYRERHPELNYNYRPLARELAEALKIADRGIRIHTFAAPDAMVETQPDTCTICGENFRHEYHLRLDEGHPLDVKAEAHRTSQAALAKAREAGLV